MTAQTVFKTKDETRRAIWDRLAQEKAARFPLPPHGRIPNFKGAEAAAEKLFEVQLMSQVKRIKINPDSPQKFVREIALHRGIVVFMPTPRLRAGFKQFDPAKIPDDKYREAATLSKSEAWAEVVALDEMPELDAIVTGSVAVTRQGRRCGKGEGYGDLEFAILIELGHPPVSVLTTVHSLQIVDDFPWEPNDLSLSWIVTHSEIVQVENPPPAPKGINWDLLSKNYLEKMPVLKELKYGRKIG